MFIEDTVGKQSRELLSLFVVRDSHKGRLCQGCDPLLSGKERRGIQHSRQNNNKARR
jgi:hypothetical protein